MGCPGCQLSITPRPSLYCLPCRYFDLHSSHVRNASASPYLAAPACLEEAAASSYASSLLELSAAIFVLCHCGRMKAKQKKGEMVVVSQKCIYSVATKLHYLSEEAR